VTASGTPSCREQVVTAGSKPNDACLKSGADHILHDVNLLQEAWTNRQQRIAYTLWFILTRTLWDFFFEERKKNKDDMIAADYADTWSTIQASLKPQSPETSKTWREAANKLAAHLTYSRVDYQSADHTPSPEMHNFILGVYAVWLAELPPERRVWFGAGVGQHTSRVGMQRGARYWPTSLPSSGARFGVRLRGLTPPLVAFVRRCSTRLLSARAFARLCSARLLSASSRSSPGGN
jgi:hypothetical protein